METLVEVLVCVFAAFGLAMFLGMLCNLLLQKPPVRPGFARIILYLKPGESLRDAVSAAMRAGAQFETYEIEAEGRSRAQVRQEIIALKAGQIEEKWTRKPWKP